MKYIADLHIHSKYSIATSKQADLEHLFVAANQKGITVLGTGDATHPLWFEEISQKLEPAEPGLFRLREDIEGPLSKSVPKRCRGTMRFMISAEISNIYKKAGKIRKNHNLVYFPDLDSCREFNTKLDRIGNIRSDGRPILGLDARDLLELVLETSDRAYLVPAHIWTPWFSVLGSKSGFDRIDQCFEDLSDHIFALETGLSSDPAMNWRVSDLDRFALISNSDAHSPAKVGREANLFDTELSYHAIWDALRRKTTGKFLGTLEFFPQEGKYHADGHRACDLRLDPAETLALKGICPVCNKPLTRGVLYRVNELADRAPKSVGGGFPFTHTIPLCEVLSQVLQVGPNSKRVQTAYGEVLQHLGPELEILVNQDLNHIETVRIPLLAEAIKRVRAGRLELLPGFDGQYGTIRIFEQQERQRLLGQQALFSVPVSPGPPTVPKKDPGSVPHSSVSRAPAEIPRVRQRAQQNPSQGPHQKLIFKDDVLRGLNAAQYRAVCFKSGPLLVTAGPGTGKTRVLTHRIAHLVRQGLAQPDQILALTFTRKAAQEIQKRLQQLLDDGGPLPLCTTLHGFGVEVLKNQRADQTPDILDAHQRQSLMRDIRLLMGDAAPSLRAADRLIEGAKQRLLAPDDDLREIAGDMDVDEFTKAVAFYKYYQRVMASQGCYDFEDLIFETLQYLKSDGKLRRLYQTRYQHILIDEYQDLNYGQYQLIRLLAPHATANICAIGDPDQAIYGFRGSDVIYFKRFVKDYPQASVVRLTRNYRSTQTILDAAYQVILRQGRGELKAHAVQTHPLTLMPADTEKTEALNVARTIESLMAGLGFAFDDFGLTATHDEMEALGFSDFAVLYRTTQQRQALAGVFEKKGIPFQSVSHQALIERTPIMQLMALARVLKAVGTYADFEQTIGLLRPTIGKQTFQIFKQWGYQKQLSPEEALQNAQRFKLPGISDKRQQRLYRFLVEIIRLRNQMAPIEGVPEQLMFVLRESKIGVNWDTTQRDQDGFDQIMTLAEQCPRMDMFLMALAIASDTDMYASRAQKVSLMTLHASKGLEFKVVFVCGCEHDLLPFEHDTARGETAQDEERRLLFVGMTRAMQRLYLCHAHKRRRYGKLKSKQRSPFIDAIDPILYTTEDDSPFRQKTKKSNQRQLNLFE